VDTGLVRTYRGDVSRPGDPQRPDEGDGPRAEQPSPERPGQGHPPQGYPGYVARPYGPTPYDDPRTEQQDVPPYVYNPYGNVSYPATYPAPPAGLGPGDDRLPARRPGTLHLALVLLVVSTLPYLLGGLLAVLGASAAAAAVPPDEQAELQRLGVNVEQVVRTGGTVVLVVALVFLLLAVLAWTGRGWARALLAAMTAGFVLMLVAVVVAAGSQGTALDGASLLVLAGPVVLAVIGVLLVFSGAARVWFSRLRR
jgi:hypothetical protein